LRGPTSKKREGREKKRRGRRKKGGRERKGKGEDKRMGGRVSLLADAYIFHWRQMWLFDNYYWVFTRSSKLLAKFQQTSSKHPACLMEPCPLSASQLPTPPPISCGLSRRRA